MIIIFDKGEMTRSFDNATEIKGKTISKDGVVDVTAYCPEHYTDKQIKNYLAGNCIIESITHNTGKTIKCTMKRNDFFLASEVEIIESAESIEHSNNKE